jgi:hypothetical protein
LFEFLVDLVPMIGGPIGEGWITVDLATGGQGDGDDVSEYDDLRITSAIHHGLSSCGRGDGLTSSFTVHG